MKGLVIALVAFVGIASATQDYLCACPDNYLPVCGSDGVTYPNVCALNCQKNQQNPSLEVSSQGPCPHTVSAFVKPCPLIWAPVCGSDGVTYSSMCFFENQRQSNGELQVVRQGPCPKDETVESKACVCPMMYVMPVCGSDGKTYSNPCMLNCQAKKNLGLTISHHGHCKSENFMAHPCMCTREYNPVCGSDGKTYGNPCTFRCAASQTNGLKMEYMGECRKPCRCTREYKPVCGSDGNTYINMCLFNCAKIQDPGLTIAHDRACKIESLVEAVHPCMCTREYNPVCGSDGKTYGNPCTFRCAASQTNGLKMQYMGECKKACMCTREYNPLCGTDGKTYSNMCMFYCAASQTSGLEMAHAGECSTMTEAMDACVCTREYNPMCGTDGKTYNNMCLLNCAAAKISGLKMAYKGTCKSVETEAVSDACICTQEYNPVCGTDGHTYSNPCVLRCVQQSNSGLKMAYMGMCEAVETEAVSDACICTQEYNPVCGTDGHTYSNPCVLRCVQQSNKDLQMSYMGECKNQVAARDVCVCTLEWAPVCGTDGKTYGNLCGLNCAAKTNNGLKMAHQGECEEQIMAVYEPICPAIWAPVCGSDGKTYGNMCEFNYHASQNPTLAKIHAGSC